MDVVTYNHLLFLDNLIYLDFSKFIDEFMSSSEETNEQKPTLYKLIEYLLETKTEIQSEPAKMSCEEWTSLLTFFKLEEGNADFLNSYVIDIENYINNSAEDGAFRACTLVKRDDAGKVEDVVVIFRGTAGDAIEWEDNIMNACREDSPVMLESVDYINNLPEEYGDSITVSGHSKGGNRAQYVTILTDRIGRCLSYDGQGFSNVFIEKYHDSIDDKKDRITSISTEYDYVNILLTPIAGTMKYIPAIPDDNYLYNHCPNKAFPNIDEYFKEDCDLPCYRSIDEIELLDKPGFTSSTLGCLINLLMISIPDECLYDYLKIIGDVAVPILVKYENFEIGKFAFDAFNLELDKCMIRTGGCIPQYQQLKEIIKSYI